ncbi:serine/threonine-protein kinase [Enhygromyxa salina]|nr:serine/threonine-protein kinase [Enhygromyxa salina]
MSRVEASTSAGWEPIETNSRLLVGELVPGTRLQIIEWIGEGSMGQVFEALHTDIQRRVALKVLRATFELSSDLFAMFTNEARACARVESRFVVEVMDFGELPDHRPFFVMELLGREDLHGALKQGKMSLTRALPILRQCCKALAAIHEAGLVHRDIKPKNVVLQREDGRADSVRVVDLGLAAEPGSTPKISGTGPYMAPEQILGEAFDGRVDVYALGCMAYVMLAGRPPFEGGLEQILVAHELATPEPITSLCPDLPAALDPILLRCLEKSPEQRWPNAHELEAALIELQIALGIVTPWDDLPLPNVDDARRARLGEALARRNHRMGWAGWAWSAVGVGATLILGAFGGLVIGSRGDESATQAAVASAPAYDDSRLEHLTNQTRLAASKAYWVYPPPSGQATALRWIEVLEAEEGVLAAAAHARANVLREEIAETLSRFGDRYWKEPHGRSFALEFYGLALVFVPDHPHAGSRSPLTPTQLADLIARAERGDFSQAELRTGKLMEALANPDDGARRDQVVALVKPGEDRPPWHASEELLQLVDTDAATPPPRDGGWLEAAPILQAPAEAAVEAVAASLAEPVDEPMRSDPPKAAALVSKAERATGGGRRADARRLFNEALALDSTSVAALTGLAELHFEAGEYSKALGYARRAAQLRPGEGELHVLLGDCYLKSMRYAEASDAYKRAASLHHHLAAGRLTKLAQLLE